MFRPGSATCLQIPQTLGEGGGGNPIDTPTPIIGGHVGAPPPESPPMLQPVVRSELKLAAGTPVEYEVAYLLTSV